MSRFADRAGMTTNRHRSFRPDSFTARLDREWEHLRRHPRSLRRARGWAGPGDPWDLAGLTDLNTLLDRTRGGGAADPAADALLCRLVELADDEALAGRIVIQRILPGLVARSAPYRDYRTDVDPAEVVVAAAWIALRAYDTGRRGRHVAASLISDATFQAFRRPLRRKAATEEARAPHHFGRIEARNEPANATDELVAVLREAAAAGLPARDADLLRHLVRAGSPSRVAEECGVTPRTIRNRRDAAVTRVRAVLAA